MRLISLARFAVPYVRPLLTATLSAVFYVGLCTSLATPAEAQLRGDPNRRAVSSGPSAWWISGGVNAMRLGTVNDGASGSSWGFQGDPRWQARGAIEKAIRPSTTLGVAVSYGVVDFRYDPLTGTTLPALDDPSLAVQECRTLGCVAEVDFWSALLVLRGGASTNGLFQVVEATTGFTSYRNHRTKEEADVLVTGATQDFTAGLGYGLGYALSSDLHVTLVQDFGYAWHTSEALPPGVRRSYEIRGTRLTLRYGFGTFQQR